MENEEEMLETTNETENVETETTEEIQEEVNNEAAETEEETTDVEEKEEKTLTQAQVDHIIAERVRRMQNASKREQDNIRREYEEKMTDIENIIKAGFGTENLEDGLSRITELCEEKGIVIPKRENRYSQSDLEVLAKYTANEIIADGYEAVDSELKKLANKGANKMTEREKLIFTNLNQAKKELYN